MLIEADRTYDDLKLYSEGKLAKTKPFNIAIREFRTFLPEMEFRGFVYNGIFTSLTQYNEFCYFPSLIGQQTQVRQKIESDFQKMMEVIPLQSYVVDFVLCPPRETLDRKVYSVVIRVIRVSRVIRVIRVINYRPFNHA